MSTFFDVFDIIQFDRLKLNVTRKYRMRSQEMTKRFKIIIERHPDEYIAYPVGFKGIITGRGRTTQEALEDVKAAIIYRITTFGEEVLELDSPVLDAFIADTGITV